MKTTTIYHLSTCDIWKSYGSMSTVIITTKKRTLMKEIKELLKDESVSIEESFSLPQFFKAFEYDDVCDINNMLEYGYLEIWEDVEDEY